jgi:hypothetical protein
MPVVRAEYGPTLPELLAPRLRALPRPARVGLAAAAVALVAALGWLAFGRHRTTAVHIDGPAAIDLRYGEPLHRVAPRSGEALRLRGPSGSLSIAVRRLRLPSYRGDATTALTVLAGPLIERMRARYAHFRLRWEGRAFIRQQPGYQIVFQLRRRGRTVYGRRMLMVGSDDSSPRAAADLTLLAARSAAVPRADAVGAHGPLHVVLSSLRVGGGAA